MSLKLNTAAFSERQLLPTSSAPSQLDADVMQYAQEMVRIHGSLGIAREKKGLHFYIACPECLKNHGRSELFKRHMAINVDKVMAGKQRAILCMKCGHKMAADELRFMPTLEERNIEWKREAIKLVERQVEFTVIDEYGRAVPKPPGTCVSLLDLPTGHPAILFLEQRGFGDRRSLKRLVDQFGCEYCEEENPAYYYTQLKAGFKATTQGRLIFYCLQNKSKVGWQARILQVDEGDARYYWHPYKKDWVVMERRDEDGKWIPIHEGWSPRKYWMAPGSRRSEIVMGYDAAVAWNRQLQFKNRFAFLVEGPLDAARLGPPALAVMGKTLAEGQAALIGEAFKRVAVIPDTDAAGARLPETVNELNRYGIHPLTVQLVGTKKDVGDLNMARARRLAAHMLSLLNNPEAHESRVTQFSFA